MLETSSLWETACADLTGLGRIACVALLGLAAAACTAPERTAAPAPAAPVAVAPAPPQRDDAALAEEAKAMLAQAETDVQRARAKRALWLKAWEDLLAARRSNRRSARARWPSWASSSSRIRQSTRDRGRRSP